MPTVKLDWDKRSMQLDAPKPTFYTPPTPEEWMKPCHGKKKYLSPGIGIRDLAAKMGWSHQTASEVMKGVWFRKDRDVYMAIAITLNWRIQDLDTFIYGVRKLDTKRRLEKYWRRREKNWVKMTAADKARKAEEDGKADTR